jgi:hypothetical protein
VRRLKRRESRGRTDPAFCCLTALSRGAYW